MSEDLQRLQALEQKRVVLAKKLRELDVILGQRRLYENGQMLPESVYHERRKFTAQRKAECANALSETNAEIKALNRKISASGAASDSRELLAAAFAIIDEIEDLDEAECALRQRIRVFLGQGG